MLSVNKKIELLSPAGSWESLMAAIQGGADAVYFGVEQLNMRAKSLGNFTINDLGEISSRCKNNNVKPYLTLNTIIYDHDINLMKRIIGEAKKHKIAAIIASDVSVMMEAKKEGIPVHISTQANVSNINAIEFYAGFADVIVLARELSLNQIKAIARDIKRKNILGASGSQLRLEVFIHGALCMAISGKCYLSLDNNYSSANRGACIQNCRRKYIVKDKESDIELEIDNEYIMSAKDLSTIDFLDKLLSTGVSVLKIEGRGRSPEYVYTTTKCYREAVDSILENTYKPEKIQEWKQQLASVFNRGFWGGYYLGKKIGEWSNTDGSIATQNKIHIGKVRKYFKKAKVGEFVAESHSLEKGDRVLITGPTTGIIKTIIHEIRVDKKPVLSICKGDVFSFPINDVIRASDKLYKLTDVPNTIL